MTSSHAPGAAPTNSRRFGARTLAAAVLASAVAFGVAGYGFALMHTRAQGEGQEPAALYQCPMHPSVVQDHPGNCPICGMKLVKVAKSAAASASSVATNPAPPGLAPIDIDPARQQLIGLRTEAVANAPIGGALRTLGRVVVDETRVRRVNVKLGGFAERVYADFVGKRVKRGDPLFSLYSPELFAAENEYLVALRTRNLPFATAGAASTSETLIDAARRKLTLLDVPAAELDRLAATQEPKKSLLIQAPVSGVVTRKDIVQGDRVEPGATPFEVVDLSVVWVVADVYESELRFVEVGMPATLTLNAFPNREFQGKTAFLDPLLDPETRSVKVRISFDNRDGELRPEMFGEVVLHGAPRDALVIPADAVIDSGTRHIVFVATGAGKFEPRAIQIGQTQAGLREVVSGLALGEQVVTHANFLVDSESRLRASLSGVAEGGTRAAPESARVLPAPKASAP